MYIRYALVLDLCLFVCTGEAPDVTGKKAAEELFRSIEHGGCVDDSVLARSGQSVRTAPSLVGPMMSALETFK